MKTQQGFIQIPILVAIVIGVVLVGSGGYLGMKSYQKNQDAKNAEILREKKELTEKNELARIKSEEEQKVILDQQKQLKETQDSLSALQKKVENIKPTVVYKTEVVQKTPETPTKVLDTAAIVAQWKDIVAEITCEWQYSNGKAYARAKGSGYVVATNGKAEIILTNYHVIVDNTLNGTNYPATWCTVKVYGVGEAKVYGSDAPFSGSADPDIGHIDLKKGVTPQSNTLTNLPARNFCTIAPEIGDKVVILGYPGIGTVGGITATEGIVSGIEGNYFVTSAKIDHGNSGGVAVLAKDNCFLGIPTWAKSGEIESMGRILSYKYIFKQ